MSLDPQINRAVKWSIGMSVLMIAVGILAMIAPHASGIAVTMLVGWLLVLGGAAHLAYAWHVCRGGGFIWGMLPGIMYVVTGGWVLWHPVGGLKLFTFALAVCLVVAASAESVLSFALRPLRGSGWLLVDGIVTFILAIMIWWSWPSSTPWLLGMLVGINMLCSGIARLVISLAVRRVANEAGPLPGTPGGGSTELQRQIGPEAKWRGGAHELASPFKSAMVSKMRISRTFMMNVAPGLDVLRATIIVRNLRPMESVVVVETNEARVDGKSVLALCCLVAVCGTRIRFSADGRDAERAMDAVDPLFATRFQAAFPLLLPPQPR